MLPRRPLCPTPLLQGSCRRLVTLARTACSLSAAPFLGRIAMAMALRGTLIDTPSPSFSPSSACSRCGAAPSPRSRAKRSRRPTCRARPLACSTALLMVWLKRRSFFHLCAWGGGVQARVRALRGEAACMQRPPRAHPGWRQVGHSDFMMRGPSRVLMTHSLQWGRGGGVGRGWVRASSRACSTHHPTATARPRLPAPSPAPSLTSKRCGRRC